MSQLHRSVKECEDFISCEIERHTGGWLGKYIEMHRYRFIRTLSQIPIGDGGSIIDVGCAGLTMSWLQDFLGYDRVVGIDYDPFEEKTKITRTLSGPRGKRNFEVFNINLNGEIPKDTEGSFDRRSAT